MPLRENPSQERRGSSSVSKSHPRREISAGVIVYRRSEEGPKFLLLYHGHGYWNFPKGKIEAEEKSLAAALRETKEETGLSERHLRIVRNFNAYERFSFRRAGEAIFKIVIFYLAETTKRWIRVSKEHEGYGWFLFRDAIHTLGKYKDSQKILKQVYGFIRGKSARGREENPPRHHAHLQGGRAARG